MKDNDKLYYLEYVKEYRCEKCHHLVSVKYDTVGSKSTAIVVHCPHCGRGCLVFPTYKTEVE